MWSKAKSAKVQTTKMHIEIQVALNFVISYLYNKLPRRRVNIFGEELEKALKQKFHGHWYPQTPFKVSIDFLSSPSLFYILSAQSRIRILPTSLILVLVVVLWRSGAWVVLYRQTRDEKNEKRAYKRR